MVMAKQQEVDYSDNWRVEHDWEFSVYGGAKEEITKDAPTCHCVRSLLSPQLMLTLTCTIT